MNDDEELPRSSVALTGAARRLEQSRRDYAGHGRAPRVLSAA
jgi:hypothetical protein